MKVKIRHIDNCQGVLFTECKFSEFHALINFINDTGGVYSDVSSEVLPIYSWQLCLDDGENSDRECYAEIIIGWG